jgi:hypothetical protein
LLAAARAVTPDHFFATFLPTLGVWLAAGLMTGWLGGRR